MGYKLELPTEVMKDIQRIHDNSDKMFGEMTKAGAELVLANVRVLAPKTIKQYAKTSRTYKTPSDKGINTKVYVSGYIPFSDKNRKYFSRRGRAGGKVYDTNKGVPVDFLAILYEYGRSTSDFPKKPFLRRAFNNKGIEQVMLDKQKELSGGLLE